LNGWLSILPFLAIVVLVGLSGALFRPGEWYRQLDKPSWTPPPWAFGPAWTALYVMIAIAGWIVWQREGFSFAFAIWSLNLVLNAAWSWLMFGRRRIDLALADASAMLVTILMFIAATWEHAHAAALLFIPYMLWVSFATALNLSIFQRNRNWQRA
jgi:tryptophan-rich sensory protein